MCVRNTEKYMCVEGGLCDLIKFMVPCYAVMHKIVLGKVGMCECTVYVIVCVCMYGSIKPAL